MSNIINSIERKLTENFAPEFLRINDDSAKHAGHESLPEGMHTSHVGIFIVSDKFSGLSRVERARAVHSAIAEEITLIHAITMLKTMTPEEFASSKQ